jgi:TRAP-type C4-dicarboxylate transport system permease small subunit
MALATLERLALTATRLLSVFGLMALMGLATMTLADGLMRWILNRPIEGVRDLGGLAIAVAIACCMPVVMIERGNITIRLAGAMSATLGRVLDALAAVLVCVLLAVMAWQIFLYALKMARANETTFVLQIPVAPFWLGVDVVLWCAVLVQAIVVLRALVAIVRR